MNTRKSLVLYVAVLAAIVSISVSGIHAQGCVSCVPAPPGWICMASGQGGEACAMDGTNCTLINPCTCREGFCPEGLLKLASNEKIKLNLSDKLIKAVGVSHPRMALALVSLRKLPPLTYSEGKINSAPVEITARDVAWHLRPAEKSKKYFAELKERVRESFKSGELPAVFAFSIVHSSDRLLLRLQLENALVTDPPYQFLEVDLSSPVDKSSSVKEGFIQLTATAWRIR